jgi:SAM-dependent methyltransferase
LPVRHLAMILVPRLTATWPLPALLAWGLGWAIALLLRGSGMAGGVDLVAASAASAALALANRGAWRRGIAALGFPLSAALLLGGASHWPAWAWLLALAPLLALYPLRAWRDAPFFPTPADALDGLASLVRPAPASVLDAGCGLGHGLAALRRIWPEVRLHGIEWSAPMAWIATWRGAGALVQRGDMWATSWSAFDFVYLFQRPETMPRAWAKAQREMRPGTWLASLEFAVPGIEPEATLRNNTARPLHLYRVRPDPYLDTAPEAAKGAAKVVFIAAVHDSTGGTARR